MLPHVVDHLIKKESRCDRVDIAGQHHRRAKGTWWVLCVLVDLLDDFHDLLSLLDVEERNQGVEQDYLARQLGSVDLELVDESIDEGLKLSSGQDTPMRFGKQHRDIKFLERNEFVEALAHQLREG